MDHGGISAMCRLLDLAPSTYYRRIFGRSDTRGDLQVMEQLIKQAGKHPTWGYRRMTLHLHTTKRWASVNSKRVRRLMKIAGICGKKRRQSLLTTDSRHSFRRYPNLLRDWTLVVRPDQAWAADITYIVLSTGEVIYLAIVMDVFTRVIRGWALSTDLSAQLVVQALKRAFKRGRCEIHHSDQGIQYASHDYTRMLTDHGCQISMSDKGAAWQNCYAERWMRTLKEEEVYLADYADFDDALANIGKFIDVVYNKKRSHSALGNLTPKQFEAQWRAEHKQKSPP